MATEACWNEAKNTDNINAVIGVEICLILLPPFIQVNSGNTDNILSTLCYDQVILLAFLMLSARYL